MLSLSNDGGTMVRVSLFLLVFICGPYLLRAQTVGKLANTGTESALTNDEFWFQPQKTFEERRQLYIDYSSNNAPKAGRTAIFAQLARLDKGIQLDDNVLKDAIAFVYTNADCNDFTLAGLIRLMYLYGNTNLVSPTQKNSIIKCLTDFTYWYDEPGRHNRCYWTENHQIIFHSDEFLAGQLLKDSVFSNNGKTGEIHRQHALELIEKWMQWRVKLGFSEWLAHSYFEEDLMSLANLYDFSKDTLIRRKTGLLMDVLMFEMALHNYHGTFASTHGRTYAPLIKGARREGTASTMKLMFGMGIFNSPEAMGTSCLATSAYRCPRIIEDIATDYSQPLRIRERHSMNVEDAFKYGISYYKGSDLNLYWSIQDYTHPSILDLSQKVATDHGVWLGGDYDNYRKLYEQQLSEKGMIYNSKLDPHAMTEVNIETYRTPDYNLSCAQQFRPGSPGYQQHPWQATLGIDATVFTNHPGSMNETSRPNYWAGNGILPNAAQYKNVLICIYLIPEKNPLPFLRSEQKSEPGRNLKSSDNAPSDSLIPFSHAYFPKDAFDEVIEKENWFFGRKGKGYIALYSQNAAKLKEYNGKMTDLIASGRQNIWICEMGSEQQWKTFSGFVSAITKQPVECSGLNVRYNSPSQGEVTYGWAAPLTVKGDEVSIKSYPRFDNHYCLNDFASEKIIIKKGDKQLVLDFMNLR